MDIRTSLLGMDTFAGSTAQQTLIDSSIPLPDGRDAAEVLCVSAHAVVEKTECRQDMVYTEGRLSVTALCRAMAGEVYGFTAVSIFTQETPLAGVTEGMRAHTAAQVMECSASPDALHLSMKAALELNVFVLAPVTTPFATDLDGDGPAEVRRESLRVRRRTALAETTLRVREEADAAGISRILLYTGAADAVSIAFTGASICEAQGVLAVTVLAESESGELTQKLVRIPFTCSFDAPFVADAWAECTVESLSVSAADVSFGVLDAEAALRLTLYGVEENATDVLADAYDAGGTFQCEFTSLERVSCLGAAHRTFTVQESVSVPKHLPDALRPVYAAVMPVVMGVFERDGLLGADVMLLTSVLYRCDEGKLYAFSEDVPVQLGFGVPFTPDAFVQMRAVSAAASGGGRTLTLDYTLCGLAVLYQSEPARLIASLAEGGGACAYTGALIYFADAGETLWDVGKRFHMPISALQTWNQPLSDPLPEGQPVVLMR